MLRRSSLLAASFVGSLSLALLLGCSPDEPAQVAESSAPREPVEATVAVDRAVATTGDVIRYTVELDRAADVEVSLPDPGAEIAGFRIVDLGRDPSEEEGDRVIERRWFELRADLVGSYILPPIQVDYVTPEGETSSIETSEIFVEVASVLPEDGEIGELRDIKDLRVVEGPGAWWPWAAGGALLAAVLAGLWWWRRNRPVVVEPPVPAHVVAFAALERLRKTDFDDLEQLRIYYFELSQVVRAYIEGRFGLNATDLTSEEISARLDASLRLEPELSHRLLRFLRETDQVKYAAHLPDEAEIEGTYEAALTFIEETLPVEEPDDEETDETEGDDPSTSTGSSEGSLAAAEPEGEQTLGQTGPPLAAASADVPPDDANRSEPVDRTREVTAT